ncbi:MAG: tetratricopeptide repeat protein [Spirochaetaceae bacterium]|jgi:tetratricopeptide (TPR) repeat protein|nr:tetratricopeptide repeat protein [Spirochaetaceae bacterium]
MNKKILFPLFVLLASLCIGCSSAPKTPESTNETSFIEKLAQLINKEDYDGALALFDTLDPEEAETEQSLLLKSSVLLSADRLKDARDVLQLVLAKNSTHSDARLALSHIEGLEGNKKQQKELLDAIVKTDPAYVPALDILGFLALSSSNTKNAESFFDRALSVDPKDTDALVGKASAYRLRRKPEDAIKMLTQAIEYHPQDAVPLAERGRIFRETGQFDLALVDLENAEKLDKNNYWIVYDKARTLLAMNKKEEALTVFERAEKINPNNFIAYVYSAGIRDDLNDYKNAIRDYEILAQLKPDYYFAYEMLGVYFMKDKEYTKARDVFMKAYQVTPDEYNYALLAVINAFAAGEKPAQHKVFLEQVLRKMDRSKLDYYIVRLFYDFSGDGDLVRRVSTEKNPRLKALGFFYLACYFEIQKNPGLAGTYYEEFKDMDRKDLIEWRIYDWVIAKKGAEDLSSSAALNNNTRG